MQTVLPGILGNLIKQVKGKIINDTFPINEWKVKTGKHIKPGEFIYDDKPETIMKNGDQWDVGYDDTRWFSADVRIPERMAGRQVYLYADLGGEALVRINGKIIGAISNDAEWTDRDVVYVDNPAGEDISIEVEATVNCGVYCDSAMEKIKSLRYTVKYAYLATVDEPTRQYWYDVKTAYDSLDYIDDKVIKDRVYKAVDESLHTLDFDFDDETFYKSVPFADEKLKKMLDEIPDAKQGTLCMIGHSHLDVAWLWTTRELVRKTARTFSNNLSLIKKYPDFKFTQSQAIVYDYMKKYYPDIFAEVKEAVKKGQWEIVGNTWVEADTNLASGESLVRQLLYGREFFLKEFGISSDIYWLPDCFGFTWAMPQIIKRSGMKYFNTSKLYYNATHKFPYSVFNWRSHSGDEIVASVQQSHYEGQYDPEYIKSCWERTNQKDITGKAIGSFGYGDGGGGCTIAQVERSERLNNMPGMPKAENTYVADFFDGLDKYKDELPTFNDELYYENHRGTFTSQAFIKKNNRMGEFLFKNAEFANVLTSVMMGKNYPLERLEEGWKLLLTNQFHDILPGTCIHEAVEMTREEYREMNKLGNEILDDAVSVLNDNIRTDEDSVIVWNMNSQPVSGLVKSDSSEFFAENVPAMGYRVYKKSELAKPDDIVKASDKLLENSRLKVVFDENGNIDSIYDKVNSREVLTGKGNLLTVFQDKPIHESAWNLELDYQKKFWELTKADSMEIVCADGSKGTVRIVRSFNKSAITQDITLAADADYIDFVTKVDWYETEKILKASFPVSVSATNATYEIAHGSIDRPTHWNYSTDLVRYEVCGHKWADLSEGDYGVSLINDCKYGYDIKNNRMRITLMRAPICPDREADKGISTFTYRLYPHAGTWSQADTVKNAFSLNQPLKAFETGRQDGSLPCEASFVKVGRNNIVVDAVKQAQDGNGIIVRMYEAGRSRGEVPVSINFGKVSRVIECNLMETDEKELEVKDNKWSFFITPHQVRTFRVIFK